MLIIMYIVFRIEGLKAPSVRARVWASQTLCEPRSPTRNPLQRGLGFRAWAQGLGPELPEFLSLSAGVNLLSKCDVVVLLPG